MSNLIATDVQGQTVDSGLVELFELDKSGTVYYFHPGVDDLLQDVHFRDRVNTSTVRTYNALPVLMGGVEQSTSGASARPTLAIANVSSVLKTALGIKEYDELVGSTITRRTTLEKYLDDGTGNSNNPPVEMNIASYVIDRVSSMTGVAVTFELAAVYDLEGIQIPRRVAVGKYCSWVYQGQQVYQKGGCIWPRSSQTRYAEDGHLHDTFFNEKDEPLVAVSLLSSISAYSNSQSYTQSSYVSYGGKNYQSQAVFTSSAATTPPNDNYWKEVHGFTSWGNTTTYSLGDLVYRQVTINGYSVRCIFRSIATNNQGNTPALNSPYWEREDLCGKTLNSCKCRFAIQHVDASQASLPKSKKHNPVIPFGSFPGAGNF